MSTHSCFQTIIKKYPEIFIPMTISLDKYAFSTCICKIFNDIQLSMSQHIFCKTKVLWYVNLCLFYNSRLLRVSWKRGFKIFISDRFKVKKKSIFNMSSVFFCFYFSTTILVYIIGPLLLDFYPQGKILPIFIQLLSTYFLSYSSTYIAGNNGKYLCSK